MSQQIELFEKSDSPVARKLSIALRAADLGVWEWDLRTDEFAYSDRAKEIFGFDASEKVTRDRIIATMHPDDHRLAKEQAARSLDPSLKRREPYRYRIYRADNGAMRWIHAFGEPDFIEENGRLVPVRFIGTLQDVTDEVLAKERLAYQEARLRMAIEASGVAVWEIDLATQTVVHSPELNILCGFPPDARPTLEEFRARYAPGERERMEALGAAARARGEIKMAAEIRHLWPDGTEKWLSLRAQLAPGESNYGGRIIGVLSDVTAQKRHEEQQTLLLSELKHRIKNSFAITQAIISQTLRGADVSAEIRSKLLARLQALASAHDEIAGGAWESASLRALIAKTYSTFESGQADRVGITGEDVILSPPAALTFSLALHELFTNAMKYGAWSTADGQIQIGLTRSGRTFSFVWVESGGPSVEKPTHSGFGTHLLDRLLTLELSAQVDRNFRPDGLRCEIRVPVERLSDDETAP